MDSSGQLLIFFQCLFTGFIGGGIYEVFFPVRKLLGVEKKGRKILGVILDIAYFTLFSLLCVYGAYWFGFPNYRIYMSVGFAFGGIIYSKSLRIILAFLEKVCYNTIKKARTQIKNKKKR